MHHNRARILILERWTGIISWYFLAGVALGVVGLIVTGVNLYFNPQAYEAFNPRNIFLFPASLVLNNLTSLVRNLFYFILFSGLSQIIRYLMKMKDSAIKGSLKSQPGLNDKTVGA